MAADGSLLLSGYTTGDWGGESAGLADFAAVKLDSNSNEDWRWQVIRKESGRLPRVSRRSRRRFSSLHRALLSNKDALGVVLARRPLDVPTLMSLSSNMRPQSTPLGISGESVVSRTSSQTPSAHVYLACELNRRKS